MTVLPPIPVTSNVPVQILEEPRVEDRVDRLVVAIPLGALAYIGACVWLLWMNWSVGIPVVLAAGIVLTLIANRAVCASLVVDDDTDAIDRLLLENER